MQCVLVVTSRRGTADPEVVGETTAQSAGATLASSRTALVSVGWTFWAAFTQADASVPKRKPLSFSFLMNGDDLIGGGDARVKLECLFTFSEFESSPVQPVGPSAKRYFGLA